MSQLEGLHPELITRIAQHLDDPDLQTFARVHRNIRNTTLRARGPLWTTLIERRFDTIDPRLDQTIRGRITDKYREVYIYRDLAIKTGFSLLSNGHSRDDRVFLMVLRDLINEAYAPFRHEVDGDGIQISLNLTELHNIYVSNGGIVELLNTAKSAPNDPPRLYLAVQIALTHLHLDQSNAQVPRLYNYDLSLDAAFRRVQEDIFGGVSSLQVNMRLLAHILNFFKHHTRIPHFSELWALTYPPPRTLPIQWDMKLANGVQVLASSWAIVHGILAVDFQIRLMPGLDDIDDQRENGLYDVFFTERGEEDEIQRMFITMPTVPQGFEERRVSALFDSYLNATNHPSTGWDGELPPPLVTKRGHFCDPMPALDRQALGPLAFRGHIDVENKPKYGVWGWVSPLPPQERIPGWMRFTMVKFVLKEDYELRPAEGPVRPLLEFGLDHSSALILHEGVVLPGGKAVLGRWFWWASGAGGWLPTQASGPFLLWVN